MRPLTEKTPKPLLKVGGDTLLDHIVGRLPDQIDELIIVIGYLGDQIKNYCGQNFHGRPVSYVWQKEKLGTFQALELCASLISKKEKFLLLYADDLHGAAGISECLNYPFAVLASEAAEPKKFGVIKLSADGCVEEIVEKPSDPPSNLVAAGVYMLDPTVLDYKVEKHPNGEYYLTDALAKMINNGVKFKVVRSDFWLPIGYPQDLEKAEQILLTQGAIIS